MAQERRCTNACGTAALLPSAEATIRDRRYNCGSRAILLVIALLGGFSALRADDAAPPVTDPAIVAQHYREIAAQPQFQDVPESGINPELEDILSDWFKRLGQKVGDFKYTRGMPAFETLLMALLVTLSVAVLIYIIVRLTRRQTWSWNETEPPTPGEKDLRAPEFYDDEIARALAARDWHAAWLAAWRQFLSRLEQRRLVEADRTRTNHEYLGQLRGQPLPASALALLAAMVDAYDRFIYGRAAIDETAWQEFHHQIQEASLLLHLEEKRALAPAGGIAA
jgi:hypothetical protein